MKNRTLIFILMTLIVLSWGSQTLSYKEETHQTINEHIAQNTIDGFSLNDYLINSLGWERGVTEFINGIDADGKNISQRVFKWLGYGGYQEDRPGSDIDYLPIVGQPTRSVNHFHNPLGGLWQNSGLNDTIGPLRYTGQSSILWSQNKNQDPGGKWSWYDARNYFYNGLTLADKTQRENAMANCFRDLGQLMHLVHDASVPAHVRNQIHVRFNYEHWVEKIRNEEEDIFKKFIANPASFDQSILDLVTLDPSVTIPIANIVDTDKYGGSDPYKTDSTAIGIAEYTNANFFSESTIFKNFPYPNYDTSVDIEDRNIPDPRGVKPSVVRQYYIKKRDGESAPSSESLVEGKTGYRLATVGFLKNYITTYFPLNRYMDSPALDGGVYKDYAEKLLPHAVGYSAGLLKYFFRGQLQVTAVPIFYKNSIIILRTKIKNLTPNETMKNGTFILTYSYRPASESDDFNSSSPLIPSGTLEYGGDEVEDTVIDFSLPYSIPKESFNSAKFTLVFKGTLGNEAGAVVAKSLILGEIKFEEEWDNGLTWNHDWGHVGYNILDWNPDNGTTTNTIVGDTLIKENERGVGFMSARVNETFVDYDYNNGQFRDILPILITPDTYLQFKIDEMSINQIPPAPPGETTNWQALIFHFNNGLRLQYFQEGQGVDTGPKTVYFTFQPGYITVDNIYDVFKTAGITIPDGPLNLEGIYFLQQLFSLSEPSAVVHTQCMMIDSIRIIEGKKQ